MRNNRRLQLLSVSCVSKSCKFFIAAAALAILTAFAQAETISLSGGQTDSSAHSLADEGDTPAVTSSSGANKATGALKLTGNSTFKVDSDSTLTLTQQLESNDYSSTRAITLYKTGSGTLKVDGKRVLVGNVYIKDGTLSLNFTGSGGSFLSNNIVTVDGASAVLDGAGAIINYSYRTGELNIINGGTVHNSKSDSHMTIPYPVYMNYGKMTATGSGADSYGNFILDNVINVTGDTRNMIDASRVLLRNTGGEFNVYENAKLTINSNIFGDTVGLKKTGAGELSLTGVSSYTTATTISAGTLSLDATNAIASSSSVTNNGAITMSAAQQLNNLSGSGTINNGGKTLTLNNSSASTFSGVISGSGALTKKNQSKLTLSGANTYTGATTISEGAIRLTDSGTLGSATSEITVTSSAADKWATLELAQTSGEINFTRNIKSNWYSSAATGGNQTGRLIKSGAATLNFSGNISSTGFETSAGTTNFGTEAAPNTNGLRLGYLRVDNGATVNYNGGTNGTMTILGGGTSFVGKTGNGTLNINSGKVGTEATSQNAGNLKLFIGGETSNDKNSVGTVNIASGVTYTAGNQEIQVGSWGTGYLNIYGTMTTSKLLRVAEHSGGSAGTITVYDGGSLTSNTELFVGSYGEGLVDVKNGGSVTAKGSVTVGSNGNGTILVENGGRFTSTVNIKLAALAGQSGTITVQKGGYLKSLDIQVGSNGTGLVDNYGQIVVTDTVKLGRDGASGSGTFNVYEGATLSAKEIYPGVTMPGTLNVAGGTVTATDIAMHGRGANATGTILITDGGSVTANLLQFGNAGYQSYAVDTTLTLDDGTLSVVNVNYPRDGAYTNKVNATVNLGKGTVVTGAAPGVESIWWRAVHINLTSAEGTEFQVDEGKQALINSTMSGSGKLIKTGEGTLLINAAEGAVDIQSLVVSSGRLDMKEFFTGTLEVGVADDADSTAIFSPGNSVGSLEVTGNFTLNSGATLLMEFDNTGTDSLLVSGTTTFEEGSILSLAMGDGTSVSPNQQLSFQLPIGIDTFDNAILDYPSFLTNLEYNSTTGILSATVDANAVPEPSTWALLALGAIGLLYLRKKS